MSFIRVIYTVSYARSFPLLSSSFFNLYACGEEKRRGERKAVGEREDKMMDGLRMGQGKKRREEKFR